jgi:Uri superfamily endonuclease
MGFVKRVRSGGHFQEKKFIEVRVKEWFILSKKDTVLGMRESSLFLGYLVNGIYLLFIWLDQERTITIGKLMEIDFKKGLYLYVGRALQGVAGRITRHLLPKKKPFWHIDYLMQYGKALGVILVASGDKMDECKVAKSLMRRFRSILHFGSSDCQCRSHLFFIEDGGGLH